MEINNSAFRPSEGTYLKVGCWLWAPSSLAWTQPRGRSTEIGLLEEAAQQIVDPVNSSSRIFSVVVVMVTNPVKRRK